MAVSLPKTVGIPLGGGTLEEAVATLAPGVPLMEPTAVETGRRVPRTRSRARAGETSPGGPP